MSCFSGTSATKKFVSLALLFLLVLSAAETDCRAAGRSEGPMRLAEIEWTRTGSIEKVYSWVERTLLDSTKNEATKYRLLRLLCSMSEHASNPSDRKQVKRLLSILKDSTLESGIVTGYCLSSLGETEEAAGYLLSSARKPSGEDNTWARGIATILSAYLEAKAVTNASKVERCLEYLRLLQTPAADITKWEALFLEKSGEKKDLIRALNILKPYRQSHGLYHGDVLEIRSRISKRLKQNEEYRLDQDILKQLDKNHTLLKLALTEAEEGSLARSAGLSAQIYKSPSKDLETLFALNELFGKLNEAACQNRVIQLIAASGSSDPRILSTIAWFKKHSGKTDEAVDLFQKLVTRNRFTGGDAEFADSVYGLGKTLAIKNSWRAVDAACAEVKFVYPNRAKCILINIGKLRAEALTNLRKVDSAIAALDEYIALLKGSDCMEKPILYKEKANLLRQLGRQAEALKAEKVGEEEAGAWLDPFRRTRF